MAIYNNEPIIVFVDGTFSNRITVRKHSATGWVYVGTPGFSIAGANYTDIAVDKVGTPYVAFQDEANGSKITVEKFNGSSWQVVGTAGFSIGHAQHISIALNSLNVPYVAYTDSLNGYKAMVKKFDGTDWVNVGTSGEASTGYTYFPVLNITKDTPRVAFWDADANGYVSVRKFNGTTWEYEGNAGFSANTNGDYMDIVVNKAGTPFVTYKNGNNGNISVKIFDGTTWNEIDSTQVGGQPTLVLDTADVLYQAYNDYSNTGMLTVRKYDGSNWIQIGQTGIGQGNYVSLGISNNNKLYLNCNIGINSVLNYDGTKWKEILTPGLNGDLARFPDIAVTSTGIPYVICADNTYDGKITVRKYVNGNWVTEGNSAISNSRVLSTSIFITNKDSVYIGYVEYASAYSKVKKFNGTDWVLIGDTAQLSGGDHLDIAVDSNNTPYVVTSSSYGSNGPTVRKFDGMNWAIVGTGNFEINGVNNASIVIDHNGVPYVTYVNRLGFLDAVVKKFDGIDWVKVGGSVSYKSFAGYPALALDANNTPYILLLDGSAQGSASLRYFDNKLNTWRPVNTNLSTGSISGSSMVIGPDSSIYVSFIDNASLNRVVVKKYSHNTWTSLDTVSTTFASEVCMTVVGDKPIVAYTAYGVFAKQFNGGTTYIPNVLNGNISFSIYPNPANDDLHISLNEAVKDGSVIIYNSVGMAVLRSRLSPGQTKLTIPVQSLTPGLYFANLQSEKGQVITKFIKQ